MEEIVGLFIDLFILQITSTVIMYVEIENNDQCTGCEFTNLSNKNLKKRKHFGRLMC